MEARKRIFDYLEQTDSPVKSIGKGDVFMGAYIYYDTKFYTEPSPVSTTDIMHAIKAEAAIDPKLNALLTAVAARTANSEQVADFTAIVKRRTLEMQKSARDRLIIEFQDRKYLLPREFIINDNELKFLLYAPPQNPIQYQPMAMRIKSKSDGLLDNIAACALDRSYCRRYFVARSKMLRMAAISDEAS